MCLDYGERRIGVAVTDPSKTIAQPLPTITRRRGKRPPYTRIRELIRRYDPEIIVIGLPTETSGEEGEQAARVREFGEGLAKRTDVPIDYWDERFTSGRARRELARLGQRASGREKGRIDAMAAALILRSYLDAQRARDD